MFYRKICSICTALILATSLIGCVEEDDDNGGDNPDNDNYERPEEARVLVSDDALDDLEEGGLEVYGGFDAPQIEGTYEFASSQRTYSNGENFGTDTDSSNPCTSLETYTVTSSAEEYLVEVEGLNDCDYLSSETTNYISGSGDCFTLYGENTLTFEGCDAEVLRVFSACRDTNGDLLDPALGERMVGQEGGNCSSLVSSGSMPAVGESYIITQTSGRAEKLD